MATARETRMLSPTPPQSITDPHISLRIGYKETIDSAYTYTVTSLDIIEGCMI